MSILIKGGRVITAADDYVGDIFVDGERISLIGDSLDVPADRVIDEAVVTAGHALAGAGYQLQSRGRDQLMFVAERRPLWTFVVAVFVPLFGLLALTHKSRSHVVVSAQSAPRGRTTVELYGVAPLRVRRAIGELSQ